MAAWLLLVLRDQYGVAWLRPYELTLDVAFLAAVVAAAIAHLAERRGAAAARAVVLRLAVAALVTVATVTVGEYGLRLALRHVVSSGDVRDFVGRRATRMAVRRNALGFRDREVPPKSADRYRIVVIGDSFTYGMGLEEKDRLSNQLQDALGPRYEVFNFGIPGNNMDDHLAVLDRALAASPDFVILQLFVNDFETRGMKRPAPFPLLPGATGKRLYSTSLVYGMAARGWTRLQEVTGITESYAGYMQRALGDPASRDSRLSGGYLRQFFQKLASAGVGGGAVFYPAVDAMGTGGRSYPFGYLHERARRICKEQGVEMADLLPVFAQVRDLRTLKVTPFDAHPSALANRRALGEVLRTLAPRMASR